MDRAFVLKSSTIAALLTFGLAASLLSAGAPCLAQVLSADIVSGSADSAAPARLGRLYVKGEKLRIEASGLPDGFFVVDGAEHVAYFVRPGQRVFMDARQTTPLTRILVRVGADDPCPQWQAMAVAAGIADGGGRWRCERSGAEPVGGRAATVFHITSADGRRSAAWIDPQLNIALRFQSDDGAMRVELRNVQEGPQAASLFEIPPSYAKFDPRRLIERIKQSDVWVEPPK